MAVLGTFALEWPAWILQEAEPAFGAWQEQSVRLKNSCPEEDAASVLLPATTCPFQDQNRQH